MINIRPAVTVDAEATARCQIACWRETYGPLVDPDRLAGASDEVTRIERWRWIIEIGPATVRLAEDDGQVIGFASFGPILDAAVDAGLGLDRQLYALYTRRAYWGTGLGHRLLEAVLGDQDALLWVLASNARAIAFYTTHGFVADGTAMEEPHFGGPEVRMIRRSATRPI